MQQQQQPYLAGGPRPPRPVYAPLPNAVPPPRAFPPPPNQQQLPRGASPAYPQAQATPRPPMNGSHAAMPAFQTPPPRSNPPVSNPMSMPPNMQGGVPPPRGTPVVINTSVAAPRGMPVTNNAGVAGPRGMPVINAGVAQPPPRGTPVVNTSVAQPPPRGMPVMNAGVAQPPPRGMPVVGSAGVVAGPPAQPLPRGMPVVGNAGVAQFPPRGMSPLFISTPQQQQAQQPPRPTITPARGFPPQQQFPRPPPPPQQQQQPFPRPPSPMNAPRGFSPSLPRGPAPITASAFTPSSSFPQAPRPQFVPTAAAPMAPVPPPQQQPAASNRPALDFPQVPVHIDSVKFELPRDAAPFSCADLGNASYRYMRPTCGYIPTSSAKLNELKLPLAILAQPFADARGDSELGGVQSSEWDHETGPVRCTRCRAYINCFAHVSPDYSKWECALCQHSNELAVNYRGYAQSGNCAELRFGSVEFQVNEAFFALGQAKPKLDFLFLLDASQAALRSGLFSYSLHAISNRLKQQQQKPDAFRVGFITYDEQGVYFYPRGGGGGGVLICGDVDEGFAPLPSDAIMLDPAAGNEVQEMIQFIAGRFQVDAMQVNSGSIGGAALASAISCLQQRGHGTGGRIVWISAQLPTRGQGKLVEREVPAVVGQPDKEQLLYMAPGDESFYNALATICLQANICLDVMACGPQFMDLATLVQVSSTTGGSLERIPGFAASNALHRQAVDLHLSKLLGSTRALGAVMKARTSTGLTVKRMVGHGFADESSFRIAAISNEYCLGIELEHDGTKLNENARVICQLAVLFTSPLGERRLRVHNFALSAREHVHFSNFDALTVANFWGKEMSLLLAERNIVKVREELVKRLAVCLPRDGRPTPLIAYCNALLKTPALVVNKPLDQRLVREPFAFADARIASRFRLLDMSNDRFVHCVYPLVLDISNPAVLLPSSGGAPPPPRLPCSSEMLRGEGIYLLFDGARELDVFVGARASNELVEAYFGSACLNANRAVVVCTTLPERKTEHAANLLRLCRDIAGGEQITCLRVNFAGNHEFFTDCKHLFPKLMEDKIYTEQSLAAFTTYVTQMAAAVNKA